MSAYTGINLHNLRVQAIANANARTDILAELNVRLARHANDPVKAKRETSLIAFIHALDAPKTAVVAPAAVSGTVVPAQDPMLMIAQALAQQSQVLAAIATKLGC